ncbi:hypothetical protein FANTH_3110 [Fusarium anthophilum]|uniref:Ferric oxidoreductase domain-containing protein n=1 Tax=Fusarium anthophilum TaxID=48485 RepID=A0A8H4ZT90_9HYPO|nr:hypothetical protein FANTH_3110 [Fusarium anthophilum]
MWSSTTMPALAIVLSALSFIPSTLATVPLEGYGRDDYPVECAQACSYAMPYNLDCPEYAGMTAEEKAAAYPSAACFANDTSYLTSIAYCIHSYCPKTVKIYKIEYFWEVKMIYDSEALTIRWSYPEALAHVNTTTPPKPMSPDETVFNRTISIDATTYQSYMNGVKGYKAVAKNESMYSILAFMTCVMVPIGFSLLRFVPLPSSWRSKFYGYFIDPPAWGRQHSVATLGVGMVPTRGQALFILYLIGINCLATFAGYPNYAPNGIFPDRHYELMRHIGNRAGSVAFANIPVVILYAGRSSVLLRLTNWSYSTFLLLHRWTATICVVQVALHSLLWLRIMIEGDSYPLVLTYPYWYVGIVGTVAFSALIPFSMLPIRKIMYEVFLITHIVLTIGALVGSWYHIVFLYEDKGGFEIWLIIAFAFWGLERLLRILRVSRYGIKKAYVTRIDDKYLRIDIPNVDAHGHCFAYFPTLSWRVWENHPFSIVNCSKGQLDGESLTPSSASHTQSENEGAISPTEASASKEMGGAMSNIRQLRVQCNATKPGITLFVQNLRGMTAKLAKKADTGIAIPVLIESSYGHEDTSRFEPNTEYPNTLVISGGVGIAGVLSSLQASLSMYAKPLGTTKLYWGIKSKGLVDVVKSMIVGGYAAGAKEGGESSNWGHIETHVSVGERMDIKRVLTTELENAIGGTTVVVCGPHAMCDEARLVLSYYMLGDITEEHALRNIKDTIAMGEKVQIALSIVLYATGAWCYDKKLGNDFGGPKEYEAILKSFLGRKSYLHDGLNGFPFITSCSTGRQTDKDFIDWKQSFANEMYFVPGIDDTLGFRESHPAWWQYWGDIIDGASIWESAWPEVHGTNEGDQSKDIKVMVPLEKKGKVFMMQCFSTRMRVKYFQEPNGTDASQNALHWALVVPAHATGFTVDVMSNGKSIGSKVLQTGLNYGTVEDRIEEGTKRLVIKNGDTVVAGTDRGRCLARECYDGIYNFNPVIMPVKAAFDNSGFRQVEMFSSPFTENWPRPPQKGESSEHPDKISLKKALLFKVATVALNVLPALLEAMLSTTHKVFRVALLYFCGGFFAPGQEYLAAVQKELDADRTKQKDSIFKTEYMPDMVEKLFCPPEPQLTEQPTTYDCKGSGICSLSTFQVKYRDHAINSLIRNDDENYGDGKALSGNCWGDSTGNGCGVFVSGKGCVRSGNEM